MYRLFSEKNNVEQYKVRVHAIKEGVEVQGAIERPFLVISDREANDIRLRIGSHVQTIGERVIEAIDAF